VGQSPSLYESVLVHFGIVGLGPSEVCWVNLGPRQAKAD